MCENIRVVGSSDNTCQVDGNHACDNIPVIGSSDNIYQLDGNQTCESASVTSYDTEDEIDSEPVRAVLVPFSPQPGQPFSLDVASSDNIEAPSSLPLTMIANFCSAYNKKGNIKKTLNTPLIF